jgi:hypothetical protein
MLVRAAARIWCFCGESCDVDDCFGFQFSAGVLVGNKMAQK